ncbi:MAG: oligoendopeptidase F [Candidatus Hydrogenedens sp.]|nr:oligoendopeptidase F [Candidatus Hydrogenedens sp.]
MAKTQAIPTRDQVKPGDTWNLAKLFRSDKAWAEACAELESRVEGFGKFRGTLGKGPKQLLAALEYDTEFDKLSERLAAYAYLRASENVADGKAQSMVARYTYVATRAGEAASYIAPEIQAIPKAKMDAYLKSAPLKPYRFSLEKLLRYKKHILSLKEERLLAMQGEVAGTASKIFGQLNDADLKFGFVTDESGRKVELSQSSIRGLLESPKRSVRQKAFTQFYAEYEDHANTLAASLSSSVLQDVYVSRVRNYPSAREAALYGDNVPVAVYDSLVSSVRNNLDALYKYYDVRKRALKLKELRSYDTAVPIVKRAKTKIPYDKAVTTICDSLAPLGSGYVNTLRKGLTTDRWVDRYENKGKRSGAFSYGAFGAPPFILMNYKEEVLDSMFTLAHEAGHSMHSWHSERNQPYQYAHYTIFVAEVASTFNEQLLHHHLVGKAKGKIERAYLINKAIDEIRGTIIRQTMFAEFETNIHQLAEAGEPLTLEVLRAVYQDLLDAYFGPGVVLDDVLSLEGLRVPHFYSAFYVYKYATGLSAAIALSRMVLQGGKAERDRYLNFLSSGGSKFPLDLLRDAGVDLEQPQAVDAAMQTFRELVDELDALV